MEYFKEFCEDFNTATMPHLKYYNYDKWEMDEYRRKQAELGSMPASAQSDEVRHREAKRAEEEKLQRQELTRHELGLAYKTGDSEKRKKLQKKLEPEDPRMKIAPAHPWAK